jgi:3-oxoadipate enol-lactonase
MHADPVAPSQAVERGQGATIVFLHGYPLNHNMWEPQLVSFSQHHHVVLLDLPGFGLARREEPVPETLQGFAESVRASISVFSTAPVIVVGHSFGGYVALQLYRQHPEIFRGLVLTNTRSAADSPEAKEKRLATIKRLEAPDQTLEVDEVARGLVAPGTWEAGGPVVTTVREMVRAAPTPTVRATLRAIAERPDLTSVLPDIRVPTLVIWGEEDRLIPPAQSQSMVPLIPAAAGVGIPAAGHLPSLESPSSFGLALENFLQKVSTA